MTLEELLALQRDRDGGHVHLVDIGRDDFRLAHTDDERGEGTNTDACPVHEWLQGHADAPAAEGIYVVHTYMPDLDSESYPVPPYELLPLEMANLDAFRETADHA